MLRYGVLPPTQQLEPCASKELELRANDKNRSEGAPSNKAVCSGFLLMDKRRHDATFSLKTLHNYFPLTDTVRNVVPVPIMCIISLASRSTNHVTSSLPRNNIYVK